MAKEKSPAFQFYPSDLEVDENVVMMDNRTLGAYVRMMCSCWREKSIPGDFWRLSKIARESPKLFKKIWPDIKRCFRKKGGRMVHPRLDRERKKQREFSRKQRDRALNLWKKTPVDKKKTLVDNSLPSEPRHSHGYARVRHARAGQAFLLLFSSSGVNPPYIPPRGESNGRGQPQERGQTATAEDIRTVTSFLSCTPPFATVNYPPDFVPKIISHFGVVQVRRGLGDLLLYMQKRPEWGERKTHGSLWPITICNWLEKNAQSAENLEEFKNVVGKTLNGGTSHINA